MSVIKPTVGRVVWFFKYTGRGHRGPLAAHVCAVHSDRHVNLMVIDEDGTTSPEKTVTLVQGGEEAPEGDYCCWMPYQVGQAAKTEAAESVAEAARRGFHGK